MQGTVFVRSLLEKSKQAKHIDIISVDPVEGAL